MSKAVIQLRWKDQIDEKGVRISSYDKSILIEIQEVRSPSRGFFGFSKSPSIVGNMTDPKELVGQILETEGDLQGQALVVLLPGRKLPDFNKGDRVSVLVVGGDRCVGFSGSN